MARDAVLVLGGSGFVGTYVVNTLVDLGAKVIVPTRRRDNARHLVMLPTVNVVEADISRPTDLVGLVKRSTAVINLVGILNETGRATFANAHVELARTIIAACKSSAITRLVQMSALSADAAGPSGYLRSKGEAEALVAASGLAWTIFRPSVVFGREDRFLNLFASLQRYFPVLALARADAKFQPIFVNDVALAMVRALPLDATIGQKYALCGPKAYTLRELVRYVGQVTGNSRPIIPLSRRLGALQAYVLEHLPGTLMSRDNLASMERDSVCDRDFPSLFGVVPSAIEAVVPTYLAPEAMHSRYDEYRAHGGR